MRRQQWQQKRDLGAVVLSLDAATLCPVDYTDWLQTQTGCRHRVDQPPCQSQQPWRSRLPACMCSIMTIGRPLKGCQGTPSDHV